jgi:hypothetical protein
LIFFTILFAQLLKTGVFCLLNKENVKMSASGNNDDLTDAHADPWDNEARTEGDDDDLGYAEDEDEDDWYGDWDDDLYDDEDDLQAEEDPHMPWRPVPAAAAVTDEGPLEDNVQYGTMHHGDTFFTFRHVINGATIQVEHTHGPQRLRISRQALPDTRTVRIEISTEHTLTVPHASKTHTVELHLASNEPYFVGLLHDRDVRFHVLVGLAFGRAVLKTDD